MILIRLAHMVQMSSRPFLLVKALCKCRIMPLPINVQEFDFLCQEVAAVPCWFLCAPSLEAEYSDSIEKRTNARKAMFLFVRAHALIV